jgi:Brp/Blh family beta-carotene 15,15'-monooxygenase
VQTVRVRRPDAPAGSLARAPLAGATAVAGWFAAGATIALALGMPEAADRHAFVPLLAGIVLIGLPRGALDHLLPARLGFAWGRTPVGVAVYLAAYLAIAAAMLGLWRVAPVAAFSLFLTATVAHWGQGDLRFLELHLGRRRAGPLEGFAVGALRGAIPVLVPLLAHPRVVEQLLATAATAMGVAAMEATATGAAPAELDLAGAPVVAFATGILALGLAGWLATLSRAWPGRRAALGDAAEVLLLVALFAVAPPYLAIGVYFLAWHSLRHLLRLALLRPSDRRAIAAGRALPTIARLARDLIPMTALALAALAGLYAWAAPRVSGTEGFVALYLVWISALTMPHLAAVALMDARPAAVSPRAASRWRREGP